MSLQEELQELPLLAPPFSHSELFFFFLLSTEESACHHSEAQLLHSPIFLTIFIDVVLFYFQSVSLYIKGVSYRQVEIGSFIKNSANRLNFLIIFWGFIGTSVINSLKNPLNLLYAGLLLVLCYILSKIVSRKEGIE